MTLNSFRKWLRGLLIFAGVALSAVVAVLSWILLPVVSDPSPRFSERKGQLIDVRQTAVHDLGDGKLREMTLVSSSGLEVDIGLRVPRQPLPDRPVVVLLAGQETGREAAEIIPDTRGVIVVAMGYPFGEVPYRDWGPLVLSVPRVQQGIIDTPAAAMLVIDYLIERSGLEPGAIELVGVSFGAFLVAAPGALDSRVHRTWLIHGAGDVQRVIYDGLKNRIGIKPLRQLVAWYLSTAAAAHHLSSEHWVSRISPRPIIVVNASQDTALAPDAVKVLHDALRQPYEILWTRGDHVHPKHLDAMRQITDLIFTRVAGDASVNRS